MTSNQYETLLRDVRDNGIAKGDRTGTGTVSVFGRQLRFDLEKDGFPLVTTKWVFWRGVVEELLWFLRGETNSRTLEEKGVKIWVEWADKETGELGPVYGHQWRHWDVPGAEGGGYIDQIEAVIESLKNNPDSRRHIVNAWNVAQIDDMALPPCHLLFQFYVADGKLSLMLIQRSADMFLGVPFNIASYALLLSLMAHHVGLEVGEFIHTFGDTHIYDNHREVVDQQLEREPFPYPKLKIKTKRERLEDYQFEDFELVGYQFHGKLKGAVAV